MFVFVVPYLLANKTKSEYNKLKLYFILIVLYIPATETAQQLKKTAGVPFHAKGRGLVKKIDTTSEFNTNKYNHTSDLTTAHHFPPLKKVHIHVASGLMSYCLFQIILQKLCC